MQLSAMETIVRKPGAGVRWAIASLLVGIVLLLLGAILVARTANSNAGSAVGWLFIATGIFAVLTAFAIDVGAYGK